MQNVFWQFSNSGYRLGRMLYVGFLIALGLVVSSGSAKVSAASMDRGRETPVASSRDKDIERLLLQETRTPEQLMETSAALGHLRQLSISLKGGKASPPYTQKLPVNGDKFDLVPTTEMFADGTSTPGALVCFSPLHTDTRPQRGIDAEVVLSFLDRARNCGYKIEQIIYSWNVSQSTRRRIAALTRDVAKRVYSELETMRNLPQLRELRSNSLSLTGRSDGYAFISYSHGFGEQIRNTKAFRTDPDYCLFYLTFEDASCGMPQSAPAFSKAYPHLGITLTLNVQSTSEITERLRGIVIDALRPLNDLDEEVARGQH